MKKIRKDKIEDYSLEYQRLKLFLFDIMKLVVRNNSFVVSWSLRHLLITKRVGACDCVVLVIARKICVVCGFEAVHITICTKRRNKKMK